MDDCILNLYETILDRRENPWKTHIQNTCLIRGLIRFLKNREETADVVIAPRTQC